MPPANKELSCMTQMLRGFLMAINVLLALASLAGVIVGAIEATKKDTNMLKFCSDCSHFNTFMIATFSVLFVFSALGFCALWHRNNCMLILYSIFLIVFFLVSLTCGIMFIVVKEGGFDTQLSDSWNDQVRNDQNAICKFEVDLECNGWAASCPTSASSTDFNNPDVAKRCPQLCTTDQFAKIAGYTETCKNKVKDKISQYYGALLGISFGLAFLTLVGIVISCKVRSTSSKYGPLEEPF